MTIAQESRSPTVMDAHRPGFVFLYLLGWKPRHGTTRCYPAAGFFHTLKGPSGVVGSVFDAAEQ
jgi:hypothetical protein